MLQSLKRALKTNPSNDHPQVHSCSLRFQIFIQSHQDSLSPFVRQVLDKETKEMFKGVEAKKRNQTFLERNKESLPHVFVGKKMVKCIL